MYVILFELRKIFELKRVLLMLILNFLLLNSMFFSGLEPLKEEELAVRREIIETYGATFNQGMIDEFTASIEEAAGGFDVDAFHQSRYWLDIDADTNIQDLMTYYNFFGWLRWEYGLLDISDDVLDKLNIIDEWYASRMWAEHIAENAPNWDDVSSDWEERHAEFSRREEHSLFPTRVIVRPYRTMTSTIAFFAMINLMILLTPLWLIERRNQMIPLQYSTKLGRRLFYAKILAAIITTTLVIFIPLIMAFIVYMPQLGLFLPMNINAFEAWTWYDLTFLQYILLTTGLIYLHGILVALMIAFLSRLSNNYLIISTIQILLTFLMFATGYYRDVFGDPISLLFDHNTVYNPRFLIPTFYAIFTLVTIFLIATQWFKEKKRDIVL